MIRVSCPGCGKVMQAPDRVAGRTVKCPACQTDMQIPAASAAAAPAASPVAAANGAVASGPAAGGTPAPITSGTVAIASASAAPRITTLPPAPGAPGHLAPPPIATLPAVAPPPVVGPPPFPGVPAPPSDSPLDLGSPPPLGDVAGFSPPHPFADLENSAPPRGGFSLDDLAEQDAPAPRRKRPAKPDESGANPRAGAGARPRTKKQARLAAADSGALAAVRLNSFKRLCWIAVGVGVLGLALCWLPIAGPAVGIVALMIAGLAIGKASTTRGASPGIAYGAAGLSIVAVAVGGWLTARSLNSGSPTTDVAANSAPVEEKPLTPDEFATQFAQAAVSAIAEREGAQNRNPVQFAQAAVRYFALTSAGRGVDGKMLAADRKAGPVLVFTSGPGGVTAMRAGHPSADGADTTTSADAAAPGSAAADTEPAAPITWAAADKGEKQGYDDLQVKIEKVTLSRRKLQGEAAEDFSLTDEPVVSVWLTLKNTSTAGAVSYAGWMSAAAQEAQFKAKMNDNQGHVVDLYKLGKGATVAGSQTGPIPPQETFKDTLLFKPVDDSVDFLQLTLPGAALGRKEDLHFQFPRSMIKQAEDDNALL